MRTQLLLVVGPVMSLHLKVPVMSRHVRVLAESMLLVWHQGHAADLWKMGILYGPDASEWDAFEQFIEQLYIETGAI